MLETKDILETINMIDNEHLDVRTVTMGISLLDCIDPDIDKACENVYNKICSISADFVVYILTGPLSTRELQLLLFL